MRRHVSIALLAALVFLVAVHQIDAGSSLRLKKLIKAGLIARAFTGKKIPLPVPLPLPIPIFKENVHHFPYKVNHHTHADIGYGFDHGLHGGYGGGFGGGYGGGYGGGLGGGYSAGGEEWW